MNRKGHIVKMVLIRINELEVHWRLASTDLYDKAHYRELKYFS